MIYFYVGGYKGFTEKYNKPVSPPFNSIPKATAYKDAYRVFSLSLAMGKLEIHKIMGTLECMIKKKYPLEHILTDEDKQAIIAENKDINISYLSLIKEMIGYKGTTIASLFRGWGGVQLFKVEE